MMDGVDLQSQNKILALNYYLITWDSNSATNATLFFFLSWNNSLEKSATSIIDGVN